MKYLFILLTASLLTGCASLAARLENPWRADRIKYANETSWEPSVKADYIDAKMSAAEAFERDAALKKEHYFAANPNRPQNIKEAILKQQVIIGMTKEELRISWGSPNNIVTTQTATNRDEEWIYQNESVYLQDGVVTSWQSIR